MTSYVLVPGACHGAWCFDDLAAALRSRGHQVLAITLTGIAPSGPTCCTPASTSETHITDVLAELAAHDVSDAVLVGHSYGGMVITAVADRVPQQVDSLVYLDAFVPRDGDSVWTLTDNGRRLFNTAIDETGYGVPPLPFFDPRATAHPLASLMQPVKLSGDLSQFRRRVYVAAAKWEGESPFKATFERLRDDPSWTTHVLDGAHNLMRDNPDDLLRILVDAA
jgi:pimeloyl-ACP methyl ester carboxylesterase